MTTTNQLRTKQELRDHYGLSRPTFNRYIEQMLKEAKADGLKPPFSLRQFKARSKKFLPIPWVQFILNNF